MSEESIARFGLTANNLRQNSDATNLFSDKLPINYYALHSLKQGVDSLNSMNTTRLGQSLTIDPASTCANNLLFRADLPGRQVYEENSTYSNPQLNDRVAIQRDSIKHNIISDDDVRNFMRSATKPECNNLSTEIINDDTVTASTLPFSPRHIARSTPNLNDLNFSSSDISLASQLTGGIIDKNTKNNLISNLVKSPGFAQRISPTPLVGMESNGTLENSDEEKQLNISDLNGNSYVGMRLAGFDVNHSLEMDASNSKLTEKCNKANYTRPYLSAPLLPNVSDSQLTEISLDTNDETLSSQMLDTPNRDESTLKSTDRKLPLSQTAPVKELLTRHTVPTEFESVGVKEPSCELMNLSAQSAPRCSTSKAMPSVTDGLSSGSEVDSPQNSPPMRAHRPMKSGTIMSNTSKNTKQSVTHPPRYFTEFTGKQLSSSCLSPQENPSVTMCHTMESPIDASCSNNLQHLPSRSQNCFKPDSLNVTSPNEEQHRYSYESERGDNNTSSVWIRKNSELSGSCNSVRQHVNHAASHNDKPIHSGKAYNKLHQTEDPLSNSLSNRDIAKRSPVSLDEADLRSQSTNESATHKDFDSDEDTDELLQRQYQSDKNLEIPELRHQRVLEEKKRRGREVAVRHPDHPSVLIEGVLFRSYYLGSTQLVSEGQPSKATRMMQAQEAVGRIKAPDGDTQPSVPVDLFVSTEKIMVLNTNLKEIMMDHALRTISYIADIGDILVLMARRRIVPTSGANSLEEVTMKRQTKIICHVFQSDEAQLIAQSIGHAFQLAYLEFLKANGIEDPQVFKDMDYQEVLNQQEIFAEELHLFADKDTQKEVIVPKQRNEPLGIVIVESGWGSMLPTVVLANMNPTGPAARCGQLNIGNQIMAINGQSLVGLPLSTCQQYIKNCRNQTSVKLTIVSCPPVVEVLIKRPDVKYQLGFSVQNGVICSLLRGGIAERGGIRVGHRIIEINGQSVVAVPHEKIVNMLATGVGEIHLRTMPTSIFRLLTGQETPHYI